MSMPAPCNIYAKIIQPRSSQKPPPKSFGSSRKKSCSKCKSPQTLFSRVKKHADYALPSINKSGQLSGYIKARAASETKKSSLYALRPLLCIRPDKLPSLKVATLPLEMTDIKFILLFMSVGGLLKGFLLCRCPFGSLGARRTAVGRLQARADTIIPQ